MHSGDLSPFQSRYSLSPSQEEALKTLKGIDNIFLTGAAGSGKSYLLSHFLKDQDRKSFPVLASTGAAAILVGGRTFHSFFGLGILEGGPQATIERALANKRLLKRLKSTFGIVIDEVSMLSGKVLKTAETIAQKARGNTRAWGGLRVIAVGDFAQLPPVNPYCSEREWAFLDEVWETSEFKSIVLKEVMRTHDPQFMEVLGFVRKGIVNDTVRNFLNHRTQVPKDFSGTRLFARKDEVEKFNLNRLAEIKSPIHSFETVYKGKETEIEKFKKNSPIPDVISIKENALIMLRQNDPDQRWVNGSLGHIREMGDSTLSIQLMNGGLVSVEKVDFTLLDADGLPVVTASNFPVTLAWGVTIHKAQGTTLDQVYLDLRRLWEPGQAYVALSRARCPKNLFIEGWSESSIKTDRAVVDFYREIYQPSYDSFEDQ